MCECVREDEKIEERKYHHFEQKELWPFQFRVSETYWCADARWKQNWYMLGLDGKKMEEKAKQTISWGGETKEEFEKRVEKLQLAYARKHIGDLRSQLNVVGGQVTMGMYVELRKDAIQGLNRWAGKAGEYWSRWDEVLSAHFGKVHISDCTSQLWLEGIMEDITHRKSRKMGLGEGERTYWVILGGILECAVVEDGLLPENSLRSLARECRVKLSTIASKDLARRSLDKEELRGLWKVCQEKCEASDVYPAMLVQVLTGLSVNELCALNVGDWKMGARVSWLEVTKAYEQKRGEEAEMNLLLDSANAYRNVVCSTKVEEVLRQQLNRLLARARAQKNQPLFRGPDGKRLTPQTYKRAVSDVLDPLIRHGVHLPFVERGGFLKGEERPTLSHGEFLRTTMEYYCREGRMNVSEIAVILGKNREHTFAISYVDWNNEQVLMYLKEKIDRWQLGLLSKLGVSVNHGLLLYGMADKDAKLGICSLHGVSCAIEEIKEDVV